MYQGQWRAGFITGHITYITRHVITAITLAAGALMAYRLRCFMIAITERER